MAKIAVVGCGAMGSVYAALMVDAGHEVHAVTLWPDHAEAMATKGLRCEGASGDRTVPIHASTTTDGIGPCDLVIIATKAFDVEAAAQILHSVAGSGDDRPDHPERPRIAGNRSTDTWRRSYWPSALSEVSALRYGRPAMPITTGWR